MFSAVSQPLVGSPSQSEYPGAQDGLQVPPTQLVVPLAFVQVFPQLPQLSTVSSGSLVHDPGVVPVQLPVAGDVHPVHVTDEVPADCPGHTSPAVSHAPSPLQLLSEALASW